MTSRNAKRLGVAATGRRGDFRFDSIWSLAALAFGIICGRDCPPLKQYGTYRRPP